MRKKKTAHRLLVLASVTRCQLSCNDHFQTNWPLHWCLSSVDIYYTYLRTRVYRIQLFFSASASFNDFSTSVPRCIIHNETLLCKWIEYKCTHQINYSTRREMSVLDVELNDTERADECMRCISFNCSYVIAADCHNCVPEQIQALCEHTT